MLCFADLFMQNLSEQKGKLNCGLHCIHSGYDRIVNDSVSLMSEQNSMDVGVQL